MAHEGYRLLTGANRSMARRNAYGGVPCGALLYERPSCGCVKAGREEACLAPAGLSPRWQWAIQGGDERTPSLEERWRRTEQRSRERRGDTRRPARRYRARPVGSRSTRQPTRTRPGVNRTTERTSLPIEERSLPLAERNLSIKERSLAPERASRGTEQLSPAID